MSLKRRNWFVRTWYKLINPFLRKRKPTLGMQKDFENFMYEDFDDIIKERRKKSE